MPSFRTPPKACCLVAILALLGIVSPALADEKPLRQTIDDEVRAAWQREKITPASRSNDAAFLRRVYLDLLGMVPTYAETTKFLADTDSRKRAKLIDRLLDDPALCGPAGDCLGSGLVRP